MNPEIIVLTLENNYEKIARLLIMIDLSGWFSIRRWTFKGDFDTRKGKTRHPESPGGREENWKVKFWNSSATVPLLVEEEETDYCLKTLSDDQEMLIWCLSGLEGYDHVMSASQRREP